MKSVFSAAGVTSSLFALPVLAFAQTNSGNGQIRILLEDIITFSNETLIPFILGIGFLFFVWGMFRYFIYGGADEESREKGKGLLISTIVAFVTIVIFWGVVNILASSSGFSGQTLQNVPTGISPSV